MSPRKGPAENSNAKRLARLEFPPGPKDQPLKSHVRMSNRCSLGTGVVNKNSLFVDRLGAGLGTQSFLQKLVSSHGRLVWREWATGICGVNSRCPLTDLNQVCPQMRPIPSTACC